MRKKPYVLLCSFFCWQTLLNFGSTSRYQFDAATLYAQWKEKSGSGSGRRTGSASNDRWRGPPGGWKSSSGGTATLDGGTAPADNGETTPTGDGTTSSGGAASLNPFTGDTSNIPPYVCLICVSLAVMLFLFRAERRKKRMYAQDR